MGMSPSDKSTWKREWTNMPAHVTFDVAEFAPRVWAAICELCGGEDRIRPESRSWRDALIVNLGTAEGEGKPLHPHDYTRWHVDGDFFVHYLDSPEQGLLVTPLFTDVRPDGGGTMVCPEAIAKVARHLYEHPEGVSPRMELRDDPAFSGEGGNHGWFCNAARTSSHFVEAHGSVGDVFLMHPLMLHSATSNARRDVRIITNPPVSLKEPFCFDRDDGKYTLVERATLRALGKHRLRGWKITAPRERLIPARIRVQEKMKQDEILRLQAVAKELGA